MSLCWQLRAQQPPPEAYYYLTLEAAQAQVHIRTWKSNLTPSVSLGSIATRLRMTVFGQVIIGPPGAGKTTYTAAMATFCETIGRKACVVNMDFANEQTPYTPLIDIRELITLEQAMTTHDLGPNGGLVYCMEYLLENIQWLLDKMEALMLSDDDRYSYVLFDFPGQVELYSHHRCVYDLVNVLAKRLDFRLCSVYLIDSFYCCEPATFISAVLLVTSTMLRLGLPHMNVLTKIDLLPQYGPLPFNLDFYTELTDLGRLMRYLDERPLADGSTADQYDSDGEASDSSALPADKAGSILHSKYRKMTQNLCEVLDDSQFVDFLPMSVEDAETVGRVLAFTDKCNGYYEVVQQVQDADANAAYNNIMTEKQNNKAIFNYAASRIVTNSEPTYFSTLEVQERFSKRAQATSESST